MPNFLIAALYKFVRLDDIQSLRQPLLDLCESHGVKGTLLLAQEGINGTIAGPEDGLRAVLAYLRRDPRLETLTHKVSWSEKMPFYRMKVRLKREIVTMGVPNVHAETMAGTYVKPEEWNALIEDPDVVLVDCRNDYEVSIGTFANAINPKTDSFAQLPAWIKAQTEEGLFDKKTRVAMFCTGGIRCEKSTAYMRAQGFENVYHLEGGILKYLETMHEEQSLWEGECFVFDERVSVVHGLEPGHYALCRVCRLPLSEADKASEYYVEGVSCQYCHDMHTEEKKQRLGERQKQVELARQRNQQHIGMRLDKQRETP